MRCRLLVVFGCSLWPFAVQTALGELASVTVVPGDATDYYEGGSGATFNRLGGWGSDLFYDRTNDVYYGVADRAYTALTPFEMRVQKFALDVDSVSGAASNFQLLETILFKNADGTATYDGRSPAVLNGDGRTLGLSL
ncbi:MAG: hypothetical protein KDA60_16505, partial [Planctomycetales bacterium]|nr:hypothetical protein [Planctomycetales bacterium]